MKKLSLLLAGLLFSSTALASVTSHLPTARFSVHLKPGIIVPASLETSSADALYSAKCEAPALESGDLVAVSISDRDRRHTQLLRGDMPDGVTFKNLLPKTYDDSSTLDFTLEGITFYYENSLNTVYCTYSKQ